MPDTAVVPAGEAKPDLFKFKGDDNDAVAKSAAMSVLGGQTGGTIRASAFVKKLQAKTRKKKMLIAFIPLFLLVGLGAVILSALELPNEKANAEANNDQHRDLYALNDDLVSRSQSMMKAEAFGPILRRTTDVANSSFAYNVTLKWCGSEVSVSSLSVCMWQRAE